jgi:hypothetical protein
MTRFTDNIYSGNQAIVSAQASRSPVRLSRTHRFNGGTSGTQTGTFPIGTQNLDAKLYILANASATVSDKITVSAGGTNLITITQFGSASGVLRSTTTGLGVLTTTASACAVVAGAAAAELSYSVTLLAGTDSTGSDYQLEIVFNRAVADQLGNTG